MNEHALHSGRKRCSGDRVTGTPAALGAQQHSLHRGVVAFQRCSVPPSHSSSTIQQPAHATTSSNTITPYSHPQQFSPALHACSLMPAPLTTSAPRHARTSANASHALPSGSLPQHSRLHALPTGSAGARAPLRPWRTACTIRGCYSQQEQRRVAASNCGQLQRVKRSQRSARRLVYGSLPPQPPACHACPSLSIRPSTALFGTAPLQ
jgi:hypothetical protein